MTHSDDDGLVIPPRIAPEHAVILPIHRSDEERAAVMACCERLQRELAAQSYAGESVRSAIDARDIRGGEKTWQHVKRGTPIRVEIGPRDLAAGNVSVYRRDRGPKERQTVPFSEFVATVSKLLEEMQQGLFDRAKAYRDAHSVRLGSLPEVTSFFAPPAAKGGKAEGIHGGFAYVHVADEPAVAAALDPLKVTVRCIPIDGDDEPGTCIVTGRPVRRRSVLAKAY